jgi:hypothetical protein
MIRQLISAALSSCCAASVRFCLSLLLQRSVLVTAEGEQAQGEDVVLYFGVIDILQVRLKPLTPCLALLCCLERFHVQYGVLWCVLVCVSLTEPRQVGLVHVVVMECYLLPSLCSLLPLDTVCTVLTAGVLQLAYVMSCMRMGCCTLVPPTYRRLVAFLVCNVLLSWMFLCLAQGLYRQANGVEWQHARVQIHLFHLLQPDQVMPTICCSLQLRRLTLSRRSWREA